MTKGKIENIDYWCGRMDAMNEMLHLLEISKPDSNDIKHLITHAAKAVDNCDKEIDDILKSMEVDHNGRKIPRIRI